MQSIKTVDGYGDIRYKNKKGDYHRTDGPAYESKDGTKSWWINGLLHREDGPARIWPNGDEWYYLKGKGYSKKEWEKEVVKLKLERILDL